MIENNFEFTRDKHMKYLLEKLKDLYNDDIKKCPNIEAIKPPLINVEDVLQAHYILADYFLDESGGAQQEKMLVGVRDYNLLCSAICRQTVALGNKYKYTAPLDICATLFFGLVKDHAFHDGNKRTALLTLLKQITDYGFYPTENISIFEKLVSSVADNTLAEKYNNIFKKYKHYDDPIIRSIAHILRKNTTKKDRSCHLNINMKEFCSILETKNLNVSYVLDNMKIKFQRDVKGFLKTKKLSYTVKFYGWTRPVEAGMMRDTLDALQITDEFPNYQEFVNNGKSLYTLINQFEIPLRRLKDK